MWDYPRPPRLEPSPARLTVVLAGHTVADTTGGYRVLETSQPPAYYLPPDDVDLTCLVRTTDHGSFCEWKGMATYWTVQVGERVVPNGAWSYERPNLPFAAITGYLAFYCQLMDECTVDGEVVHPQPGGFYGGWITSNIVGPFKGAPGTLHW